MVSLNRMMRRREIKKGPRKKIQKEKTIWGRGSVSGIFGHRKTSEQIDDVAACWKDALH